MHQLSKWHTYDLLFLLITTPKLQAPVQPSYEQNIITAEYSHEKMKKMLNKYLLHFLKMCPCYAQNYYTLIKL